MQAKQYLRELKRLDTCIRHKMQEKAALYNTLTGGVTDAVKVQTSNDGDSMTNLIIKIGEIEERINARIDEYIDLKDRIIDQIHGLDNETFIEVLHQRYIEFKRLEEVAVNMNYAYDYIRRLHGHALQEFERRYSPEIAAYEKEVAEKSHSDML